MIWRSRPGDTIPARSFEALLHACAGDARVTDGWQQRGVDLQSERTWYPLAVWREAIDDVARVRFPELSLEEGRRAVGRIYIHGFARTTVGRVLASIAEMLGPERCLARVPRYIKSGRTDIEVDMEAHGYRDWRVTVRDAQPNPYFVMGALEGILQLCAADGRGELVQEHEGGYLLSLRWTVREK